MSKWRPIDTAPREIEFRCLLGHPYSVVTGYWDGKGWRNERGPHDSYFPATHWQTLPDRPQIKTPTLHWRIARWWRSLARSL